MSNSQTILENNERIKAVTESLNCPKTVDLYEYIDTIYITTSESVRPAEMFGGNWELLPEGYALWTTTTDGYGGTIISAGLPNITGTFQGGASANTESSKAFTNTGAGGNGYGGSGTKFAKYSFDANTGATTQGIYRDDVTTVQPPAYRVFAWRRVGEEVL